MKIRGWLYVSESSAMFISDDMKESVSYLNWVDLRDEKLRKEFLKTFVLLRIDHRETYSSYHLYPIRINESNGKTLQRDVYDRLQKYGIAANLHYIPVHRHPFYERFGFKKGDFPEAEKFHKEVISLPIYTSLGTDQNKVISYLQEMFSNKELGNL